MENLVTSDLANSFGEAFRGRRVLVTGHTGFKGAWLAEWLLRLGAEVTGFALAPAAQPALFDLLGLSARLHDVRGDVRNLPHLQNVVRETAPEFVFHLAAQPLVRRSYAEPVETYATNVMGTVNVLEAVRQSGRRCTVVAITTDKCYENREWTASYREDDRLGGHDPYSSSKAAAELVIQAYRRSYFSVHDTPVAVASARAGNVIGGGDWAEDRIVPDCMRALERGARIAVRHPAATRPWQHVLEPLSGYLWLAASMASAATSAPAPAGVDAARRRHETLCGPFNFGPSMGSNRNVADLVTEVLRHWPGRWEDRSDKSAVHEAGLLALATDKAHHLLGWEPVWDFRQTVEQTVSWYRRIAADPALATRLTAAQISAYTSTAEARQLPWAASQRPASQAA